MSKCVDANDKILAEATVTLRKNTKIDNLALITTLNLTQTLTLMLILTQTQNLLFALLFYLWALHNEILATS